jgi:L-ribulokinase
MGKDIVAGVDFGSDSVRVVLLNAKSGQTLAAASCVYPRWSQKLYCDPSKNQFRQHPLDYIDAFEKAMKDALASCRSAGERLLSIGFDATGSTPCPVDRDGTPLALLDEWKENPNAMFYLWKDHTAVREAMEVNQVFSSGPVDYTKYQGVYSSEWYWAKILHAARTEPFIQRSAWAWVEHADWFPALLSGKTEPEHMYRCACAAGHKALWHSAFGGLPSSDVLGKLDPYLVEVAKHYSAPSGSDTRVGTITAEWAKRLGVNGDVIIGGSSLDAHAGAVGAGIQPNTLVKVVGTSTVDMLISNSKCLSDVDLRAFCGQAENSIVPGYAGIEAGQAAFGDIYAWFRDLLLWPVKNALPSRSLEEKESIFGEMAKNMIPEMEKQASRLENAEDILALDWFNGRRYPNLNEKVKGALCGLDLGSSVPQIFRALALSTVFGSKHIFDSLTSRGIRIDRIIAVGGIAQKSSYVMQMMADVLDRPLMAYRQPQVCARGAAIYAAVSAGVFNSITEAQKVYCKEYQADYIPNGQNTRRYSELYNAYLKLGNFMENIDQAID